MNVLKRNKMKKYILILLALTACTEKKNKSAVAEDNLVKNEAVEVTSNSSNMKKNPEEVMILGDTILIKTHSLPIEVNQEFINENQKLKIELGSLEKTQISGKITSEKNGQNIRFNNVLKDNHSIDGPFGKDLKYNLTEKGNYALIIGKSQMADGSQIGKFKIEIQKD